ncbi:hypothetical protein SAMN04488066_101359 [Halorubrum aquaticum]|uniref:Uncharacterized protein n=1 Tax=Halorubrum aquaticum TaxID=387340 RepID=A0A1I2Z917_9EURY|nr:hypothetical protein [Halorubrum aquaticum]SFH34353.1 hypothetical protein SAMN04488066_101359 [Halorubrum aquaticum]
MATSEELPEAFFAIVDGVRCDVAHLWSEWRQRTAYGRVRLTPLLVVYPFIATFYLVAAGLMYGLFRGAEIAVAVWQRLCDTRERLEPEVYDGE